MKDQTFFPFGDNLIDSHHLFLLMIYMDNVQITLVVVTLGT